MVKCAMSRYQAAIYNWVKATGTLRLDPNNALAGKTRHPFVPLNNKVMELRKVRLLLYWYDGHQTALWSCSSTTYQYICSHRT